MPSLLVQDSFDTARVIAYYRALETEREGGLFQDPYAKQLAGERGAEVVHSLPRGEEERWPLVMRTQIYDEIIQHLLEQETVDIVINLAAGLDTRPYRLPLPATLRWIEVDHEDVITYKQEHLADQKPRCLLERVALDITDAQARQNFLKEAAPEGKSVLVLTEGLLIYLQTEHVRALAADLQKQTAIRWWLTEYISPLALKRDEEYWNTFAAEGVKTRFAPEGGLKFFESFGWESQEFRVPIHEMRRLRLPVKLSLFVRILIFLSGKVVNTDAGGFVLLRRKPEEVSEGDKEDEVKDTTPDQKPGDEEHESAKVDDELESLLKKED
ncbi:class I SAM-dependent methyltransferase [Ktedonospora formicarum]|uniref:S-adenosyl-L-methionine-dependent methyltransferase n=1 Tax=Ktedonospora formicarum TaxID=2778364 RepID=A0A8J3HT50_9CHLR|nr:class I SAM-dependent methyltransferase [Ktedonospora formicarum]GHO42786.1 hypothetical protein KSX_09490 [Ktedonospora formicarum]